MPSSAARRTISLLRSLCEQAHLNPAAFILRLCDGFRRYGPDNHLSPDFDLRAEWDAEVLDVVAFAAVAVSRGMVARDDPALLAYMLAAKRLVDAQAAMLANTEKARDAAFDCWDADDHDA